MGLLRLIVAVLGACAGGVLISMGAGYCRVNEDLQNLLEASNIPQPTTVILVLGFIIFILSVLSLLAVVRTSIIGRLIYCTILCGIIAVLVIIAILVFVKRDDFYKEAGKIYDGTWKERDKPGVSHLIDSINKFLHCCGSNSATDYIGKIPQSCCATNFIDGVCPPTSLYREGCRDALMDYIASKASWIGYVSIVVSIVLSFLVMSSLGGKSKKTSRR